MFQQVTSIYVPSKENDSMNNPIMVRELTQRPGVNTMGIVLFCLAFGITLSTIGERGRVVKDFFSLIFEITSKMITTAVWLTGFAVASIIAGKLLTIEELTEVFSQLGLFIFCVLLELMLHQLIILPLIYIIVLRKQPYKFLISLIDPWITAFAAESS